MLLAHEIAWGPKHPPLILTYNIWEIRPTFTSSKWNMDKNFGLKICFTTFFLIPSCWKHVIFVSEIAIFGKKFHFYQVNGSENSFPHEVIPKKIVVNFISIRGIHQLRGQNFAIFCLPPPCVDSFIHWAWTKTDIFDPLPLSSCPRSYWMTLILTKL